MTKAFGFDLLIAQIADHTAAHAAWLTDNWRTSRNVGDTPIERLMFSAIYMHGMYRVGPWDRRVQTVQSKEQAEEVKTYTRAAFFLIVQRQVELTLSRVDFLIQAPVNPSMHLELPPAEWKQLIVECDGHDFHERTKDQAARDRSRDREYQMQGYEIFRFTGSELWRNPWGCAEQIFDWADKAI